MSRGSIVTVVLLLLAAARPAASQTRFRAGNMKVTQRVEPVSGLAERHAKLHSLIRDQINFGECFEAKEIRRLPGTYYHPKGPVGLAFGRYDWFPGPVNTFQADVRLPASLTVQGLGDAGWPTQLATLWSEPPVAVLGLNTGTPAAYGRPMQVFHFYEPSKDLLALHARSGEERFFHFIPDACERGVQVEIVHGPPRQALRERGPRKFYRLMILEACSGENGEKLFLDLFTKEGIAQCLEHLTDDGILCVHTSHRFVDLPPVLAAIGKDLRLHVRRGFDEAPGNRRFTGEGAGLDEVGHFSSEWVFLSRDEQGLEAVCRTPAGYKELLDKARSGLGVRGEDYWSQPRALDHVWTDKGPNLLHGILRGHPLAMRYSALAQPVSEFLRDALRFVGLRSPDVDRIVLDLGHLPRPVEDMLVERQLRVNPRVEALWP